MENNVLSEENRYATKREVIKYLAMCEPGCCWNCKYFDPGEEVTLTTLDVVGVGERSHFEYDGFCRRYPPTAIPDEDDAAWPFVKGTDWCGEFVECGRTIEDLTFGE